MIEAVINRADACPLTDAFIKKVVTLAGRVEPKVHGLVEITFVSNKEIRRLNRVQRGMDKSTDVLSFAWAQDRRVPTAMLGEVYLSYQYIFNQAKRFAVSQREETVRMLTHGLLHLAGHDHLKESEAKKMFALQEKVVSAILKK